MPIIDCYTLLGSWPQAEVDLTVDALAAGMQARGVGRSLVTHATAIFYDASLGNNLTVEICGRHPPLTPVAVLNPLDFPKCMDEAGRRLEQGVRVFRLCPREHEYPFSGSVGPLRDLLAALASAALILVDLGDLPAPVITADVAALLPCPTIFSADGGALGTLIHAGRESQNVWVDTSHLDAGGSIEAAVKHLGANRVVFGSRSPLRGIGSAIMSVQYAELPDGDRSAIFEGNIAGLLG